LPRVEMAPIATTKKLFLITGANSGLGFECSLALAKQGNAHVILAGRSQPRIDEAVEKVKASAAPSSTVEGAIVDLASLHDVRQFARGLIQRDLQFFAIVCNAGVNLLKYTSTKDGFEAMVGVNHTAHFLLLSYLKDRTQRIVMLSSEMHDPNDAKSVQPIDMSNIDGLAKGLEPFNFMQVYATSKLCNLLYTKEFARRFPHGPEILAYTPGLVPDTALFRDFNFVLKIIFKYVATFLNWWSGGRNSTPENSGGFMARIASADSWGANGWKSGDYIRVDEVWEASVQACDEALGNEMWEKTDAWVTSFAN
jgi:NAD(P)-dependent dehydrogenase (short-subunit alcohol dehydrogenase family)